jgi:hypothetical protein
VSFVAALCHPQKAIGRVKNFVRAPPLNNRTFILYFNYVVARRSGNCLFREGEDLLFPVPADQFPVLAKSIPCFNLQGIRMQDIEIDT